MGTHTSYIVANKLMGRKIPEYIHHDGEMRPDLHKRLIKMFREGYHKRKSNNILPMGIFCENYAMNAMNRKLSVGDDYGEVDFLTVKDGELGYGYSKNTLRVVLDIENPIVKMELEIYNSQIENNETKTITRTN